MDKMCFTLMFAILVALHMGSNPVEASPQDGDLLFDSITQDLEALEMPGPCQGQSYCFEEGENYPKEKIDQLLEDMGEWKVKNPEVRTNIDSRNGDTYDEPDCVSNSTESPIYYIIDTNGKLRVVVQSREKFQQIYSVKWCRDEGPITRDTLHFLKNSKIVQKLKLECVSTKMDLDFLVLSDEVDSESQKPKMEIASAKGGIPVCCRCRYSVDG